MTKILKKQTKTAIKKRLDKLFSLIVREDGVCVRCGKTRDDAVLHCSHVYSRRHLSIRWNELNAKILCAGCHMWWGCNPVEAYDWIISSGVRTKEQMDELRTMKESVRKWSISELLELEQLLKNKVDGKS